MGVCLSQLRLAELKAYRSDLEYKINLVSSGKLEIASHITDLMQRTTNLDKEDPEAKKIEAERERYALVEKKLDLQLQNLQNQLKMIDAEEQSVKQSLDGAIQRSYSG